MLKNSADIMRCPNIVRPSLVIAVAVGYFALFLAPCCLAAAIEAEGLQQELLVPFNDLLPPLSDAELQEVQATSTIATTTTTSATTANTAITVPATTARARVVTEASVRKTATTKAPTKSTTAKAKPTKATTTTTQKLKKSQYQLDQQSQKQQLAVPILDLNPEVPPALPDVEASTVAPVVSPSVAPSVVPPAAVVVSASPVKVSTEPKQAASTQHFQQVQAAQTQFQTLQHHLQPQKVQQQKQHRQQQQQQQQQLKQQLTKSSLQQSQVQHKSQPQAAVTITEEAAPPQPVPQQPQRVNVDHLRQYLEYIYHPTTRRPSRGPLPTLTPFPRHFK